MLKLVIYLTSFGIVLHCFIRTRQNTPEVISVGRIYFVGWSKMNTFLQLLVCYCYPVKIPHSLVFLCSKHSFSSLNWLLIPYNLFCSTLILLLIFCRLLLFFRWQSAIVMIRLEPYKYHISSVFTNLSLFTKI